MTTVNEQKALYSVQSLCAGLGLSRASYYRRRPTPAYRPKPIHPRALSMSERDSVLGVLNSQRFCDQAPGEIYASLLDEGKYLCSERTMYGFWQQISKAERDEISCAIRIIRRPS